MTRSDDELLSDALDHLRVLRSHLERTDLSDQTVADAVSLRLASAIETISVCTPATRNRIFGDEWNLAWSTRNRIAHGYAYVDRDVIRATVERDIPRIEEAIRSALLGAEHRAPHDDGGAS